METCDVTYQGVVCLHMLYFRMPSHIIYHVSYPMQGMRLCSLSILGIVYAIIVLLYVTLSYSYKVTTMLC